MKNLTVNTAEKYITEQGYTPRHDMDSLVKACRIMGRREGISPSKIFKLLCFNDNTVIAGTHSYGFHTSYGRYLIDSTVYNYRNIEEAKEYELETY